MKRKPKKLGTDGNSRNGSICKVPLVTDYKSKME